MRFLGRRREFLNLVMGSSSPAESVRIVLSLREKVSSAMSIVDGLDVVKEMVERGWEGFLGRPQDSLGFRFYVQPAVAILLAVRDGIRDSRRRSSPFLSSLFRHSTERRELLKNAWLSIRNVFFVSVALDVIYQLMKHPFVIYPIELLFTATCLALVPYLIVRGPAYRVAKKIMDQKRIIQRSRKDLSRGKFK